LDVVYVQALSTFVPQLFVIIMDHIRGSSREQIILFPEALEEYVSADNPVRFLDAFVDQLEMAGLGFRHATVNDTGRPPYDPKDLLKLYLYGYLNRLRSSRLLERESRRNLEVLWLLKRLSPDHKTISDFRRVHAEALHKVFQQFVQLCQRLELFGAELVAIDSTKFKASNARDRVKDKEQLDKSLAHINESISQYLTQLDENDTVDEKSDLPVVDKDTLQTKIAVLKRQQLTFEQAQTKLDNSHQKYVSLTDPDCRLMKNERRIEPAYALQTAVDDKHSLIIDYELTNDAADNNHLSSVAIQAKTALGCEHLTVCADAGYYDTVDLKTCEDNAITTYVPVPKHKVPTKTKVPTADYYPDRFVYDRTTDTYRCPQANTMHRFRSQPKSDGRRVYLYRTVSCGQCPVRASCTTSPRGRYVYRWDQEAVLDRLKLRLATAPPLLRRRKAIIEHVFGTLKKIWGYGAFLLRGLNQIASEVALMSLAYNIRRVFTLLGTTRMMASLSSA
jgi:transposase